MRNTLRTRVLTVAALAAAPLMAACPALADQSSVSVAQSSVPAIAPGSSARVDLAETNTGASATFSTMTFTAPSSAKFADTNLYFDGRPVDYVSCSLANSDTTLNCSADGALEFPANSQTAVGVDVQVPADAAAASTLSGGSMYVPSVSADHVWSFAVSTGQAAPATATAPAATAPAATDDAAASAPDAAAPAAAGAPAGAAAPAATPTDADATAPADADANADSTVSATNNAALSAPASAAPDAALPAGADMNSPDAQLPAAATDLTAVPNWVHDARVFHVRTLAGLNIRKGPGTGYAVIGSFPAGATVGVTCKVNGTIIDGNPRWYRLSAQPGWISARYAQNLDGIPPFC